MQAYDPIQDLKIKSQEEFQKFLLTLQFWQFSQERNSIALTRHQIDYQIDLSTLQDDTEILDLIVYLQERDWLDKDAFLEFISISKYLRAQNRLRFIS